MTSTLLTTVAALAIGVQSSMSTNLSTILVCAQEAQKQERWVFLGWGELEKTSNSFQAHHIKFWPVSFLDTPEEYFMLMPDPRHNVDDLVGFLVDADHYADDRQLAQKLIANGAHFNLVPFSAKPAILFPGPPDADLQKEFMQVRPTLEQIMKLAQANPNLDAVRHKFLIPGMPNEAKDDVTTQQIIPLLKKIGPTLDLFHLEPGIWQFDYWGFGNAVSDEYLKGFAYLERPPKRVVRSLDNFPPNEKERRTDYVHIDGHWYLFAEFIPD